MAMATAGLTLSGEAPLEQLDYTLDAAGNVECLTDQLNGAYSRDYGYDALHRLTWDNGVSSSSPTYSYDANGNRTGRTATVAGFDTQTLAYTATSNRLSTFNGTTVTYNGMGSITGGVGSGTFAFGANRRLSQITEPARRLFQVSRLQRSQPRPRHDALRPRHSRQSAGPMAATRAATRAAARCPTAGYDLHFFTLAGPLPCPPSSNSYPTSPGKILSA